MIAALFVERDGCYFNLPGVDPWDEERDARKYDGPHRVVAHPPCQLWGKMANCNFARWGGEHNRRGNDGGCFESALASVRRWGGVLEHPADTYAWGAYGIAAPYDMGWERALNGEWVCEVWQSAYDHPCRKRTWLLYVGNVPPLEMRWERKPGTHQIGRCDQREKVQNKPTISGKAASATPIPFRDALIALAMLS